MESPRKIIHIDMDAFYASVEQRDNPEYRGKPLAVGGSRERGVVAAASYEARKFGIHSAMASSIAYRKCPSIIFVKPRFDVYKSVSRQIRAIFLDYTDLVEPLSLDEAYLDVTSNLKNMPSATLIAKEIKQRIKAETGLTASAGVSINKFLAKVASDYKKPDGLYLIEPHRAESFVAELPISKFYGVGKVTAEKMLQLGIHNGADMKKWSEEDLVKQFGKTGRYYYHICRGIDHREVSPNRIRKSLGTETTYDTNLVGTEAMLEELPALATEVEARLQKAGFKGKTLTLKVKFSNFEQITRSKTVGYPITDAATIVSLGRELMQLFNSSEAEVRLLGLTVSNGQETELVAGTQLTIEF
jgi:DNA polymerase IV